MPLSTDARELSTIALLLAKKHLHRDPMAVTVINTALEALDADRRATFNLTKVGA